MRTTTLTLLFFVLFFSCGKQADNETATETELAEPMEAVESAAEPEDTEEPEVFIKEHHVAAMPIVSDTTDNESEATIDEIPIIDYEEFDTHLTSLDYEPEVVEEDLYIIPLDETTTVYSYSKKDEMNAAIQVVRDGEGEIQEILFTDKKHQDVYNVQAGMSTKEVKRLRKELKHMQHKGDHFLYDDQSNILYLLDVQLADGTEITEAEIDNSEVRAIVWKHKKHEHRKGED